MTRQEIVIAIVLSFDTFRAPGNKLLDLPSVTLLLLREFYNVSFFFLSFFFSFFLPFLSFLSFFFLVIIVINPPVRAKPQIGVSLFLYPCREIHGAPFSREFLSISERSIIYIYIYTVKPVRGFSLARKCGMNTIESRLPWQNRGKKSSLDRVEVPFPVAVPQRVRNTGNRERGARINWQRWRPSRIDFPSAR